MLTSSAIFPAHLRHQMKSKLFDLISLAPIIKFLYQKVLILIEVIETIPSAALQ